MKPELKAEIASTRDGRDITRGFVDALPLLPPGDTVLDRAGGYRGYEELLRDEQVASTFNQRRLAVIRRPWQVMPGGEKRIDKQAAKLVEDTLTRIGWDQVCDQMLYARFFGFAVAEIMWRVESGRVEVAEIRVRDRRRFGFAPDRGLRLLTSTKPDGETLPDRKFWVLSVGASHFDEPYGRGLAQQVYWPVWFKRQGARFWAVFMEKFAAPTAVGKFPAGTSEETRHKLMEALEAVSTDSGVAIPEGMSIELLEASRGGQATYAEWMDYWDRAISKAILGQTMTTEDGSSLSQAKVHMDVRQDIVTSDADLLHASAASSWVRWLIDFNFPGAAYPKVWRDMEDAEDLQSRAERDEILHRMGWKLTDEAVSEVYGDDYERHEPEPGPQRDPVPPTPATTDVAEAPVEAAERQPAPTAADLVADRLAVEAAEAHRDWLRRIEQMVAEAASMEDLRERLLNGFADLPPADITRVMQAGFAVAELAGRFDAAQESR